jgi:hypothetical protein
VVGTAADVCSVVALQGAPVTIVPGTILARDTFGFGPQLLRPTGGNGTLKPVAIHVRLNGFWAEQPCSNNAVWMSASGSGVQSWNFSITNTDPKEPPSAMMPAGLENGVMTVFLDGESVPEFLPLFFLCRLPQSLTKYPWRLYLSPLIPALGSGWASHRRMR